MEIGSDKFVMRIDLNVLNHLGMNLYSNIPSVLSEVVANSWDADAKSVTITVDVDNDQIVILDNGIGMNLDAINEKYLTIGYAKRERGEVLSPTLKRPVMGRKGIGKLSLFSIANTIEVYSKNGDELNAFRMNAEQIKQQITTSAKKEYNPEEIDTSPIDFEQGTKIVLKDLKKKLSHAEGALKRRLSRRFSVIGSKHEFQVFINGQEVSIEDRDYFHKIEYLWYYGDDSSEYEVLAKNKIHSEKRLNLINGGHRISGWIGLVKESGELQDGEDNLNKIVLLVRGKMAKEDLLEDFREGGLYTKYLFGEIKADFIDDDDQPDIATSSRQDIFEEDDRYLALKEFLLTELKHIQNKRADYKSHDAEREALSIPSINKWYNQLGKDTKSKAKKLFAKINQIAVDKNHQKQLFSHGVLAFESLRYKDALDALDKVSMENLDEFLTIFKEFDQIEATLYYKITKERLEIINTLQRLVYDENTLEKILQEYLFKYLWLLDPSWDRATETPTMEQAVNTEFNAINAKLSAEEKAGRVDIRYKKTSGKHVIIELKKASVVTSTHKLQEQVNKYKTGLKKVINAANPTEVPVIECVCVVGKAPKNWDTTENKIESIRQMEVAHTRVVTYHQLINEAQSMYNEYLQKHQEAGNILNLIKEIEEEN